jgi:hypothetical protein
MLEVEAYPIDEWLRRTIRGRRRGLGVGGRGVAETIERGREVGMI